MAVLLAQHRAASSSSAPLQGDCDAPLLPPIPEPLLIRDILYICQGIDGQFVRFRAPPQPRTGPRRTYIRGEIVVDGPGVADEPPPGGFGGEEQAFEDGIAFVFDRKEYSLPAPTRTLLHQLSELGWLYRKIDGALHPAGGAEAGLLADKAARKGKGKGKTPATRPVGMVEQSLHAELKKEMTEYFRLVAVLEAKLEEVEDEEDVERAAGALKGLALVDGLHGRLTLRKLDVWTQDVRLRMRMMGTLIAEVGGANVGGAFLSLLHTYTSNGDPFISSFSSRLLQTLSVPFFSTLSSWIYDGELRDPYDEFFVALNPALDAGADERYAARRAAVDEYGYGAERSEDGVAPHELWAEKFSFRREMLPAFLEESFGKKIYSTGKSLNFMKYSCEDASWVVERNRAEDRTLQYADMADLERSISLAYSKASERLFELFFDKFRLMEHLRTLKDYLMLGKGDFVEILMEQLGPSLSKPANALYRHNLTSALETAIRGSTPPSSEALSSVLRRLDARMLDSEQGQVGWDVFLLEYKVDAPLSTVLDPEALDGYRAMFKHLWEIKRVEFALNEGWRTLMTNTRLLKRDSTVSFDLHQTRISLSEMIFFVRQVEYYCHLEVVACQWAELEEFVKKREGDLDKLIEAHQKYLRKLTEKALLKAQAKRKREVKPLVDQLRDIFKVMLQYKNVADDLFSYALQHESYARSMVDNARDGRSPVLPIRAPSIEALIDLENRLADYAGQFREKARELVSGLERSPDLDMKFLAVRLNFNYQFRPEPTGAKSEA
ncbi:Microtubule-nucleating Tub4p (gamma-tubulin) complex component [Rhodosporidiobolus nylandii]